MYANDRESKRSVSSKGVRSPGHLLDLGNYPPEVRGPPEAKGARANYWSSWIPKPFNEPLWGRNSKIVGHDSGHLAMPSPLGLRFLQLLCDGCRKESERDQLEELPAAAVVMLGALAVPAGAATAAAARIIVRHRKKTTC